MNKEILEYLNSQKVGVLAVEMLDGSPHGATVHFAHTENPFTFLFETNKSYRKAEPILKDKKTRASLVVGTSEDTKITFQLDGFIELLGEKELELFDTIYLAKFPTKVEKAKSPDLLKLKFTPTWWRFTDFNQPKDKRIITSK